MAFATTNPTTGQVEKTFDEHTPEEVDRLLERAATTFATYRRTSFEERARWMTTAAELLEGELPAVASVLTTEMGKTFAAAKGEVGKCALTMRFYAERAESMLADEVIATSAAHSAIKYQPIGPVLAVSGFRDEADALQVANDTVYGLAPRSGRAT